MGDALQRVPSLQTLDRADHLPSLALVGEVSLALGVQTKSLEQGQLLLLLPGVRILLLLLRLLLRLRLGLGLVARRFVFLSLLRGLLRVPRGALRGELGLLGDLLGSLGLGRLGALSLLSSAHDGSTTFLNPFGGASPRSWPGCIGRVRRDPGGSPSEGTEDLSGA